ncbi:MAG TPA: hypothetical protein VH041_16095 [Caldimonas sp.]|nr:hypothetical protein [Caldimonas sp.]HEX4235814.1 hypothetical protein [Caldimonas sp.]
MAASSTESLQTRIETAVALTRLLERVEASRVAVDADQYRTLVERVKDSLTAELPARALDAILAACPASAEVYENANYEQSGLSRSPLERSVATEMLAAQAIDRARRGPRPA